MHRGHVIVLTSTLVGINLYIECLRSGHLALPGLMWRWVARLGLVVSELAVLGTRSPPPLPTTARRE